jgi:hypothetical protein
MAHRLPEMGALPPLLVFSGPSTSTGRRVAVRVAEARSAGWAIVRGWAAPMTRDRVVCTGTIGTADDARRALLSAMGGAGLIVAARLDAETLRRFLDDLRRLGPVEHLSDEGGRLRIGDLDRALLARLGEGLTVAEAAAELGLSRSAADRRIAAARRILGVRSTAEAVVAAIADDTSRRRPLTQG